MARGRTLKHDATTTVTLVAGGEARWVVKRYNIRGPWHALRRQFQSGRARNCWRAAEDLAAAGIDTPRPVAALEERRFGLLRGRSYFISELVEGETLDEALSRAGKQAAALMDRTADIVRRLRASGIVHGDLKATNIIVSHGRVYLVDLDATRKSAGSGLCAGREQDLDRFLRNWQQDERLLAEFKRRLDRARPEP